jgi:hypothetical protein
MRPPPCPQPQHFEIVTGFITPGSDFPPPHPLDASINVDVFDPTEANERIRIVEVNDRFDVVVDWCICGPLAESICGCWNLDVYIDDIDGVGPTHGLIGTATEDVADGTVVQGDDTSRSCYEYRFEFPAGSVQAGVYDLVVVITLRKGSCDKPGRRLGDWLGYAEIPVLVFFQD